MSEWIESSTMNSQYISFLVRVSLYLAKTCTRFQRLLNFGDLVVIFMDDKLVGMCYFSTLHKKDDFRGLAYTISDIDLKSKVSHLTGPSVIRLLEKWWNGQTHGYLYPDSNPNDGHGDTHFHHSTKLSAKSNWLDAYWNHIIRPCNINWQISSKIPWSQWLLLCNT